MRSADRIAANSRYTAGLVRDDGRFVGYEAGPALLIARVGQTADTIEITIAPRTASDSARQ